MAASTTSTQRAAREDRIAASTSGIGPCVAVRRHPDGNGNTALVSVSSARSPSSIRCWVPTLVAFSRPDLIQRRTVSGSRLVRRAASGTVNIVAIYYNKSGSGGRRPGTGPDGDAQVGRGHQCELQASEAGRTACRKRFATPVALLIEYSKLTNGTAKGGGRKAGKLSPSWNATASSSGLGRFRATAA